MQDIFRYTEELKKKDILSSLLVCLKKHIQEAYADMNVDEPWISCYEVTDRQKWATV